MKRLIFMLLLLPNIVWASGNYISEYVANPQQSVIVAPYSNTYAAWGTSVSIPAGVGLVRMRVRPTVYAGSSTLTSYAQTQNVLYAKTSTPGATYSTIERSDGWHLSFTRDGATKTYYFAAADPTSNTSTTASTQLEVQFFKVVP